MGSMAKEENKGIMDSVEIKKYEQDDHLTIVLSSIPGHFRSSP